MSTEVMYKVGLNGATHVCQENAHSNECREFYQACKAGNLNTATALLQDSFLCENCAHGQFGETPFAVACVEGHVEVVEMLLRDADRFVDFDTRDELGWTPFFGACHSGHTRLVELLLTSGEFLDIDRANGDGRTPFQIACLRGHIDVVRLLLARPDDIDFDHQDIEGRTALHLACIASENRNVVALLLDSLEVSRDICDTDKLCAGDLAAVHKNYDLLELFAPPVATHLNVILSYSKEPPGADVSDEEFFAALLLQDSVMGVDFALEATDEAPRGKKMKRIFPLH